MSKFKIEHGASKVRLVQLKTNIEDSISNDIDLMCQWSDNERSMSSTSCCASPSHRKKTS